MYSQSKMECETSLVMLNQCIEEFSQTNFVLLYKKLINKSTG